ncbi:MAG: hypothetical protein RLZZ94_199 [Bacteroidota bacterium]
MPHHSHTSIFTTVSGVVGGVGKAITAKPLLMAVTLPGLSTVVLYAAASAAAGYVVKKALDSISEKLNKFFKENFKDDNE